jgi:hypothetical protein
MENVTFRCDSLVSDLKWEINWGPDYDDERKAGRPIKSTTMSYRRRSPFEWLAGVWLSKVYETHFGHRPPTTKKTGKRPGRYVRFVQAVCAEHEILNKGKLHTGGTIIKALTDAQSKAKT